MSIPNPPVITSAPVRAAIRSVPARPPPRSNIALKIGLGLAAVALLALSGFLIWYFGFRDSSSPEPEPEPEPGPAPGPAPGPEKVKGCMDSTATNYSPEATEDDGSCEYSGKFIIGKGDKCIYVNPEYGSDGLLHYGDKPDDKECISFNLATNKDGSILDKSSEITMAGDMGCLKWYDKNYLEPADCSESSYKFIINDDDTVNISPSPEDQSEKIHYNASMGVMHKWQDWSSDPVLPAKFIKA